MFCLEFFSVYPAFLRALKSAGIRIMFCLYMFCLEFFSVYFAFLRGLKGEFEGESGLRNCERFPLGYNLRKN